MCHALSGFFALMSQTMSQNRPWTSRTNAASSALRHSRFAIANPTKQNPARGDRAGLASLQVGDLRGKAPMGRYSSTASGRLLTGVAPLRHPGRMPPTLPARSDILRPAAVGSASRRNCIRCGPDSTPATSFPPRVRDIGCFSREMPRMPRDAGSTIEAGPSPLPHRICYGVFPCPDANPHSRSRDQPHGHQVPLLSGRLVRTHRIPRCLARSGTIQFHAL